MKWVVIVLLRVNLNRQEEVIVLSDSDDGCADENGSDTEDLNYH